MTALAPRTCTAEELPGWFDALLAALSHRAGLTEEQLALRLNRLDLTRARGVFERDQCVATLRSFDQRLTTVGGAALTSNAITGVGVRPTHRRRGLLSRLMVADLAAARERGTTVSTLISAEYPIYGRFGFGPATTLADWEVDVARAGLDPRWSGPDEGGSIAFSEGAEVRRLGPELHRRVRDRQPGAVDRTPLWWERCTGELRLGPEPWTEPFHVIHWDADGVPQGLATYASDNTWENKTPQQTLTVRSLIAATPAAERALWHYLLSIDWIARVRADHRAPDELLPHLLPDPRAASVRTLSDFLWLRPLDVPRMLATRRYAAPGELVLEVRDPLGLAAGRFLLEASDDGANCRFTTRTADLTLDVGALSSLYLGDVSAARLSALGRLDEETTASAARADLLLHTGRRPWCPDIF